MLEIKHLTKIYKTKGGADVRALDDVSIDFEETGLVFLLGKSGSGKSTLLNLAGGLDEPTSGEVVVMGKSSRDFSGSDFDSYRNTFIGFVFQEYNVLNEFNVADNVALALELQGKTKEREKVMKILEEVDLAGYAKRKPNTLSGGQKQRIAIARALVKDPQIIMADEPTGALDSATGKQVFDTLKKLSETRLVLVVSHDREFAEIYGDRIVELKDGKIISDVVKVKEEAKAVTGNLVSIGSDTLAVKKGARLDDATMQRIRAFLESSTGDVLISKGEKEIESFRRVNRIDDENAQEHFRDTREEDLEIKEYDGKQTKFIRSRLPARKAIKIGASGLKLKPVRLVFTILLSLVSFVMFGLFSTMMLYDPNEVLVQSFLDSDAEYLSYRKEYQSIVTYNYTDGTTYSYDYTQETKFTPAEVKALGEGAVGVLGASIGSFNNTGEGATPSVYYNPRFNGFAIVPEGHALRQKIVAGGYPEKSNEICVSSYFFDCMKNATFYPVDDKGQTERNPKKIENHDDLVGETILANGTALKIVGIFDSGEIPATYDDLKEQSSNSNTNYELQWKFSNYLDQELHTVALSTEEIESVVGSSGGNWVQYFYGCENYFRFYATQDDLDNDSNSIFSSSEVAVYVPQAKKQLPVYRIDGGTAALKDDEVILSYSALQNKFFQDKWQWENEKYEDPGYIAWNEKKQQDMESDPDKPELEDFIKPGTEYDYDYDAYYEANNAWSEKWNAVKYPKDELFDAVDQAFGYLSDSYWDQETQSWVTPTPEQAAQGLQKILEYFSEPFTLKASRENSSSGAGVPTQIDDMKVVGFYREVGGNYGYNGIYCSQNFYDAAGVYSGDDSRTEETKYELEDDATYSRVLVPMTKNETALKSALSKVDVVDPDTDVIYTLANDLYSNVAFVNSLVEELSLIFLIVGIVLMVFAALLLLNFITLSISNKKRDIGILRAVGARGSDVFKIFFAESGIIVGICAILSIIGSFAVALFLNSYLKAEAGLQATLFVFGVPSVGIMLGVALVVAFVGTFLPVYLASRKKPVESIRAL